MAIVPDQKDWTWVLERPCQECGFDASTIKPTEVAGLLRKMVPEWRVVLAHPDASRRPSQDRWSTLEYSCHVRDVFAIYTERLSLMLTEINPQFENWDQDATAISEGYSNQDPAAVADALREQATTLADLFESVAGEQWKREGRRSDGAHFTIETFALYFIHDPIHHLYDVGAVVST